VIKKFSSSAEVFNCHILFISEDESDNVKKIASRTAGYPILLVSESDGMALRGACINFVIISDHLKLEINKDNIEQRNLNIASELLQLGKLVR
jgi:glutamine amidotransferase PdxT